MLFKLAGPDMLNTTLIDVASGARAYNIVTVLSPIPEKPEKVYKALALPSLSSHTSASSSTSLFLKKSAPALSPEELKGEQRQTTIADVSGSVVAHITWNGRHPDITIGDEKVGALTDLFGSTTVRFMPKILAIPTRFDTEYVWTATSDSLTLYDYDTETVKGAFHQNTIRIPSGSKAPPKLSSPSKFRLTSPSTYILNSSSSSTPQPYLEKTESDNRSPEPRKHTFIPTHLPGVGSCYLEFAPHPLAQDIEVILSFLMMEILRRGRFSLTPYTFEKPRLWQIKEAGNLLMRRIRRHTV